MSNYKYTKKYFDELAIKKGFKSDKQRGMIYKVLREMQWGLR